MKVKVKADFIYKDKLVKVGDELNLNPIMFNKISKMGCVEKVDKTEPKKYETKQVKKSPKNR